MVRTPSGDMARIVKIDYAKREADIYWPGRCTKDECEMATFKLKLLRPC